MRGFAFLCSMLLAAAAPAAERLDAAMLAQPGARQAVPFARLLGLEAGALPPFEVEIPAIYRDYEPTADLSRTLVWCRMSDWSRLRRGKPHSGRYGALVAQRSELVTWHAASGLFRDGNGRDERSMPERFERLKAKNVRVERIDAAGVPMLLLEADIKPTERLRVVYVAAQETTRMLYYLPQRPWSEGDELVWGRLRDGLVAARGQAR